MYIWHGMFIISWSNLFRILHSIIHAFVNCVLSLFFQLFICSFLLSLIDSLIYSWMHSFIRSFILSSGATAQYIINHPHYRPCSVLHMLMSGSQSSSESCFKMMGLMYIEIQYGRTVFFILLWQSFHVFPPFRPFVPSCHQQTKVEVKPPRTLRSNRFRTKVRDFFHETQSNPEPITGLPVMVQKPHGRCDLDFCASAKNSQRTGTFLRKPEKSILSRYGVFETNWIKYYHTDILWIFMI